MSVSDVSNNGPGSYTFTNTFSSAASNFSFGSLTVAGVSQNYNFVDSYVIDLPTSLASAYAFSLSLAGTVGLSNLSARLYSYAANGVTNYTVGGIGAVNGAVAGPWSASTVSTAGGVTIDSTALSLASLTAGEYVLQIVGLESGTANGTYNGTLAVTPVPLPAALPLLLSGLGGFGLLRRRRPAAA